MEELNTIDVATMNKFKEFLTQYDEGLISTSEVLTKILTTMTSSDNMTIAICDVVLRLREQEQREADKRNV